jgi:putative membrane protein
MRWIFEFLVSALLVYLLANYLPGVSVDGFGSSIIVLIVLSILNLIVKPVLKLIALPINILTLGLFSFVINALIVWMCSGLVDGFQVDGFLSALFFSLVLSIVQSVVGFLLFKD